MIRSAECWLKENLQPELGQVLPISFAATLQEVMVEVQVAVLQLQVSLTQIRLKASPGVWVEVMSGSRDPAEEASSDKTGLLRGVVGNNLRPPSAAADFLLHSKQFNSFCSELSHRVYDHSDKVQAGSST